MTNSPPFQIVPPKTAVSKFIAPATSDAEADRRFKATCQNDPYPSVPPSLLNSADIWDYVNTTGMIHPFYEADLKSASYQIRLLGEAVYWDERGQKHSSIIGKGDTFSLGANSIAFVTTEPTFRLPDYIAIRFNLRIKHVHRGILLGTGPLVDPGFCGKLLIPLHNLTTNTYTFTGGEELIWVEFTKISPHSRWHPTGADPRNQYGLTRAYTQFPEEKKYKDAEYYLSKASPHSPIRSSLPEITTQAAEKSTTASIAAEQARNHVQIIQRRITAFGLFGGVIALIAISFTYYQVWISLAQLQTQRDDQINAVALQNNTLGNKQDSLQSQFDHLKADIDILKQNLEMANRQEMQIQLEDLARQTKEIEKNISDIWLRVNDIDSIKRKNSK